MREVERAKGLHGVLRIPFFYSAFQRLIGVERSYKLFIAEYLDLKAGERILDVGCGPGDILAHMPSDVNYVGIDLNADYIDAAQDRFGQKGQFFHGRAGEMEKIVEGQFDVILAYGLLHHLEDQEAMDVFSFAHKSLKKSGRAAFIDPCYTPDQSIFARWFVSRDRGTRVRTPKDYQNLARSTFKDTKVAVRNDLVNIPWTHCILICRIFGAVDYMIEPTSNEG
jgi:SAM-dependent methyltransferase